MCIGIPMRVVTCDDRLALCDDGGGQRPIDLTLIGPQPPGTWVLTFLGGAREVLTPEQARRTRDALQAVAMVLDGEDDIDHLFADLIERPGRLPPHLEARIGAGQGREAEPDPEPGDKP